MEIHTIDLNFQNQTHAIAAYLVIGPRGAILIETGPASTLPTLKTRLLELGITPTDLKHVFVTHIHLDHAGAAGWWARLGAKVYVHPRGARHLVDPAKLIASATRIYGDRMKTLWGEILPAPTENVIAVEDRETIPVAGLSVTAIATPGHAQHHHVYRIEDVAFAGDAVGVRLPASPFIDLPAPPPEFDLDAWQSSLDRLEGERFTAIYPTHFGELKVVPEHLDAFRALLGESVEFMRKRRHRSRREGVADYRRWKLERANALGVPNAILAKYEAANPLEMSVDGILRFLRKGEGK